MTKQVIEIFICVKFYSVYMLRRSRSTAEGGSHQCELCGRMAFKLYSTDIEVESSEQKQSSTERKRGETETAKVRLLIKFGYFCIELHLYTFFFNLKYL